MSNEKRKQILKLEDLPQELRTKIYYELEDDKSLGKLASTSHFFTTIFHGTITKFIVIIRVVKKSLIKAPIIMRNIKTPKKRLEQEQKFFAHCFTIRK